MSRGRHFTSAIPNIKKYVYLPVLKKSGRNTIVPFFESKTRELSQRSSDPLLIAKPIGEKKEGEFHETDKIIRTSILQTGKGSTDSSSAAINNEKVEHPSSDSSSESELDFESSEPRVLCLDFGKSKASPDPSLEPPKKKFKRYGFKVIE